MAPPTSKVIARSTEPIRTRKQYEETWKNPAGADPPTPYDIAQRAQLRGLGRLLIRMDVDNHRVLAGGDLGHYVCSWWRSLTLSQFLSTADASLHGVLTPYRDVGLLEAHGEQILELFVGTAPEWAWRSWLYVSLEVVARADNLDVFLRLFALCRNDSEFWEEGDRVGGLLCSTARTGGAGVLSVLLAVDFFLAAVQGVEGVRRAPPALQCAAVEGHRDCVAALIKAGAPLEGKSPLGSVGTALCGAAQGVHEGVVVELLAAGADVNNGIDECVAAYPFPARSHPGFSPLGNAAAMGSSSLVRVLLRAGASFGKNRMGSLPLVVAAQEGSCGPLNLMLSAGADVNAVDSTGRSALHAACFSSHEGAVELLLRHHASLTSRTDDGLSPHDVVAMGALHAREMGEVPWGYRVFRIRPSTLSAAETATADRIHDMLHRAGAWRRRGWVIMMRARRRGSTEPLDDDSPVAEPSPPAAGASPGHDDEARNDDVDRDLSASVERVNLADGPSKEPPAGLGSEERSTASTKCPPEGTRGRHDSPGQAEAGGGGGGGCGGWEHAMEWLLRCPDERGVFREILGFL